MLFLGGVLMMSRPTPALFMIGAMAIILLLVGIHNSWDTVTFIVTENAKTETKTEHAATENDAGGTTS